MPCVGRGAAALCKTDKAERTPKSRWRQSLSWTGRIPFLGGNLLQALSWGLESTCTPVKQLWWCKESLFYRQKQLGRRWEGRACPSNPSLAVACSTPSGKGRSKEIGARRYSREDPVRTSRFLSYCKSHHFWAWSATWVCISGRLERGIIVCPVPEGAGHEVHGVCHSLCQMDGFGVLSHWHF